MLEKLVQIWQVHMRWTKLFQGIFQCLDKIDKVERNQLPNIVSRSVNIFSEHVFELLKVKVASKITETIDSIRRGVLSQEVMANLRHIKDCVEIFEIMGFAGCSTSWTLSIKDIKFQRILRVYDTDMEIIFLGSTKAFYEKYSVELLKVESMDIHTYLQKVQTIICNEEGMVDCYMNIATKPKAVAAVLESMIIAQKELILLGVDVDALNEAVDNCTNEHLIATVGDLLKKKQCIRKL